jgi:hypothetical protein
MLIHFRSARMLKVPVFVSLLVLAWLLGPGAPDSSARMEDPVPYPHLEGWPDPLDDFLVDENSPNFANHESGNLETGNPDRSFQFESDVTTESRAVPDLFRLLYLLNRILLAS